MRLPLAARVWGLSKHRFPARGAGQSRSAATDPDARPHAPYGEPPTRERKPRMTGRVRFDGFEFQRFDNGRCRAAVTLEGSEGIRSVGRAEGLLTREGELRCSAEAAIEAIRGMAPNGLTFELVGIKAVRAFDATVLIVCLRTNEDDGPARRVGACLATEDPVRGAATAVLNATNRIIGNDIV